MKYVKLRLRSEDFEKRILEDDDFSKVWGNLGFIYGKQWRDWSVRSDGSYDSSIDQISNLIYQRILRISSRLGNSRQMDFVSLNVKLHNRFFHIAQCLKSAITCVMTYIFLRPALLATLFFS